MVFYTTMASPVGELTLCCDAEKAHLIGVWMAGQRFHGGTVTEALTRDDSVPLLKKTQRWLERYFAGEAPEIAELPLAPRGNVFRRTVWQILCGIPYGKVMTYGEVARECARRLGKNAMSAQAAGGAVGHNPISIIIPCHRVVGAHGKLTGYGGGLSNKVFLLALEGVDLL